MALASCSYSSTFVSISPIHTKFESTHRISFNNGGSIIESNKVETILEGKNEQFIYVDFSPSPATQADDTLEKEKSGKSLGKVLEKSWTCPWY